MTAIEEDLESETKRQPWRTRVVEIAAKDVRVSRACELRPQPLQHKLHTALAAV